MIRQEISRLLNHTVVYGLGGVLNRFISFLLLPVFTSYLTPTDYGIISILGLITFVAYPVFSLGLSQAMAPFYFDGGDAKWKGRAVWTTFMLLVVSATSMVALGCAASGQISQFAFNTPQYSYLVVLSLLSVGLSVISTPFTQYLQFEERSRLFVTLTGISTLVTIGLNIVAVVVLQKGVQGLLESQLLGRLIATVLFAFPVVVSGLSFGFDANLARIFLRVGIPLVPAFAFSFVLQDGNKYILQGMSGLDVVGIYTIGFNFGSVLRIATGALEQAWVPFALSFADKQEQARVLFGRFMTYYVIGVGTLSLLFYLAAKPLVMLMTRPAFHDAYQIVGLAATAAFLGEIYSLLLPAVYFAKEVQSVSLIQAIAALAAILLNVSLIQSLGMFGAGLALTCSMLTLAILTHLWNWWRGKKYLQVRYEWDRICKFSAFYLAMILVMLWPRNLMLYGEALLSSVAFLLMLLVVYVLLTAQERKMLWAAAKPLGARIWHSPEDADV